MSEKYLKPYQYYSDLYDKFTVEECRRIIASHLETKLPPYKGKELSEKGVESMRGMFIEMHLYFVKGERYIKKEETIREWMRRDERHDLFFESAKAPEDITCLTCGKLMFVSSKHLTAGWNKEPDRVMFFYDCPLKHLPMRVFYDNGEEYRSKPHVCSKCQNTFDEKHKKDGDKIIITYTCKKCGNIETEELDLTPTKEVIDPDFPKDRDRFCISDKDGEEYRMSKVRIEGIDKIFEKDKERENNKELYSKVAKIKKLKIIDLEQLIAPALEKAEYIKFHFKDPEIGRDVTVPFVVHDSKPNRENKVSVYNLERLLKKTLADTNWRLMSDGVNYRLGMLEGRLRAYEKEEDLIKLVNKDK